MPTDTRSPGIATITLHTLATRLPSTIKHYKDWYIKEFNLIFIQKVNYVITVALWPSLTYRTPTDVTTLPMTNNTLPIQIYRWAMRTTPQWAAFWHILNVFLIKPCYISNTQTAHRTISTLRPFLRFVHPPLASRTMNGGPSLTCRLETDGTYILPSNMLFIAFLPIKPTSAVIEVSRLNPSSMIRLILLTSWGNIKQILYNGSLKLWNRSKSFMKIIQIKLSPSDIFACMLLNQTRRWNGQRSWHWIQNQRTWACPLVFGSFLMIT